MAETQISARSKRFWKRLVEWYGVRVTEQYGELPPEDWCELVDESSNEIVKRALSLIRQRYVQYPPTLPQFEQCLAPTRVVAGPSSADRLCAHVMRTIGTRLTEKQRAVPWTYLGSSDGIAGVVIPDDGDSPGYRVMLADIT